MKIITGWRGQGKTREAVMIANASDAVLVVADKAAADRVAPLLKHAPVTFTTVVHGELDRGKQKIKLVIDDADRLLAYAAVGCVIEAITLSARPEPLAAQLFSSVQQKSGDASGCVARQ